MPYPAVLRLASTCLPGGRITSPTATGYTTEPTLQASVVTTLHGYRLAVVRGTWVVVAVMALVAFAAGVPVTFRQSLNITDATRVSLVQVGLEVSFPAYFYLVTDTLTLAAFALIAVALAWRRSDDWAVLFIALMLLLTGLLYTHPAANAPLPLWVAACLFGLAEIGQVGFFFLFPDGRFIPRRSAWLLLPMLVWRPAIWALVYLPGYRRLPQSAETYGVIPQNSADTLLVVGLLVLGLVAQVYRYRRVSTPRQREQARWLLLGSAVTVGVVATYVFIFNVLRLPERPGTPPFLLIASSRVVRQLALLAVPITITISILRYRLFDIDVVINRALVYTALSALLVLVYFGSVIVLQQLFRALTGGASPAAVVVSTLTIAGLFQPLRRRVQSFIDRRFYRRKYDVAQTLLQFRARLRDEVDLDTLTGDLLAVVEETMQPAHASLWIRDDPRRGPAAR